jgi:hypothetical protein
MGIFTKKELDGSTDDYRWRDGAYLCTVNNSFQADILESKLRSEDIPTQRKYVGASGYLEIVFGNNLVGDIEIYVPAECLEDAKNIIVPVDLDDCDEEDEK